MKSQYMQLFFILVAALIAIVVIATITLNGSFKTIESGPIQISVSVQSDGDRSPTDPCYNDVSLCSSDPEYFIDSLTIGNTTITEKILPFFKTEILPYDTAIVSPFESVSTIPVKAVWYNPQLDQAWEIDEMITVSKDQIKNVLEATGTLELEILLTRNETPAILYVDATDSKTLRGKILDYSNPTGSYAAPTKLLSQLSSRRSLAAAETEIIKQRYLKVLEK